MQMCLWLLDFMCKLHVYFEKRLTLMANTVTFKCPLLGDINTTENQGADRMLDILLIRNKSEMIK